MRLVELWEYGPNDSRNYILVTPMYKEESPFDNGWVINGEYYINRNKKDNIIKINVPTWTPNKEKTGVTASMELATHEARYLGDVELLPTKDDWAGYNWTIQAFEDTKKVLGRNLIKKKIVRVVEVDENEEPAF